MPGKITKVKRYYRATLQASPETLFVFGDNYVRRGLGGQAKECRGEPNAVGIPTKISPSMHRSSFFQNSDFWKAKEVINEGFDKLESHLRAGGVVVWPEDGIGGGLAKLDQTAPKIYEYILKRYEDLRRITQDE